MDNTQHDNKLNNMEDKLNTILNECRNFNVNVQYRRIDYIMGLVVQYIELGGIFSQEDEAKIINYLENEFNDYGTKYHLTINRVQENLKKIITNGFKFSTEYLIHCMCLETRLVNTVMNHFDNKLTWAITHQLDNNYANYYYRNGAVSAVYDLIFAIENIGVNFTDLEKEAYIVSQSSNEKVISMLLDDSKITITENCTIAIATLHSSKLFEKIIMCGGILNTTILEYACLSNRERCNKIKFVLDNKVDPTQKAFQNIIASSNEYGDEAHKKFRWMQYDPSNSVNRSIELLVDAGYKITYDDLKLALNKKIVIQDIERFNIVFDESYLDICSKVSMYPYKTKNLQPNLICLQNECKKSGNLQVIKKMIKESNLKPDTECLKSACRLRSNAQTIKFLVENGAKVNIDCIKCISDTIRNRSLDYILDIFIQQNAANPVNKNENNQSNDNDNESNDIESNDNVTNENMTNDNMTNDNMTNENMTNDNPTNENMINDNLVDDNGKKQKVIITKIPHNFIPSDPVYDMIPEELRKILKLNDDTTDFLEFRSKMIGYLIKNKMITTDGIKLKSPFLYNDDEIIQLDEINEWIYGLLIKKEIKEVKKDKKIIKDSKIKKRVIKKKLTSIVDISDDQSDELSDQSVKRKERQTRRIKAATTKVIKEN